MDARDVLGEAKQVGGAIATSGMGSPAAIALAAVSVLVVGGVALAKHEYSKQKKEKHLARIKKILELYNEFLVEIPETGFDEHPTLPPPFILDKKDDPTSASALKLNAAIRKDLIKDKSVNNDAFLNKYSHHVKNAKMHILGLYDARLSSDERSVFTKGTDDDVTSSVLTYLLVMLSEHCTKFEGYQADMAYLDGLIKFINAFASLPREGWLSSKDPKKRQRFERLKHACKELRKARKLLADHSNSRTLKSFVDELMSATDKDLIPDLTALFTKFIVPEKDWQYVDAATPELLASGLLRPEYRNTHTVFHQKEVEIPDSIFKIWLQQITAGYLDSEFGDRNPIELKDEHLTRIKDLFKIVQNFLTLKSPQAQEDGSFATDKFIPVGYDTECQFQILAKMPLVFEPNTYLVIKTEASWKLYEIKEDRQLSELSLESVKGLNEALAALPAKKPPEKLTKKEKTAVNLALTHYRNVMQLKSRAAIFLDLALLLDQLTDINSYCEKLSDCIRDLGEIYVSNPHHCNFIFDSLNALGQNVSDRIGVLLKAVEKIEEEQDSANDMLIKDQLDVATQLSNKLIVIRGKVSSTISGIVDKHNVHNNRWGKPQACGKIDSKDYDKEKKKKAIQEMLNLAARLNTKYKIDHSKYELCCEDSKLNPGEKSEEEKQSVMAEPQPFLAAVSPSVLVPDLQEEVAVEELIDSDAVLEKLRQRLDQIKRNEKPNKKTSAAYEYLYDALNDLDLKVKVMQKEKEPLRQAKARASKKLTFELCKSALVFLNYDPKKRVEEAFKFRDALRDELSASRNKFLDEHKAGFGKILKAVKEVALCLVLGLGFYLAYQRGGFFRTSTRAAAYQVEESCENLTKSLAVGRA